MSLKRLMRNFFTIQTSKEAIQTADGSIDRSGSWVNHSDFKNIKGHFQEKSRQTVIERYARHEEEHNDLLYHLNLDLNNYFPSVAIRILRHSNPLQKIIFPISESDSQTFDDDNDLVHIYEFKGHIEQVPGVRRRYKFFIIKCERNNRRSA